MKSKWIDIVLSPVSLRRDVRSSLASFFDEYLRKEMKVYDIGCGSKPFKAYMVGREIPYIGVDIEDGFYDPGHIDLVGSAYAVPAEDGCADAVISNQVIEHLERPLEALDEAARILKKGGILFLAFPFLYPLHALPHDYGRYSQFYMDKILTEKGFEILHVKPIGGFWYCIALFWHQYLQAFDRSLLKNLRVVKILSMFGQWLLLVPCKLEGAALNLCGRDIQKFRERWTANYIYVARKT